MVVKVKEPLPSEYGYFRDDLVLFTYLHLAPVPDLTKALLDSGIMGIAYETVQMANGELPLLVPMSEVAGRMAVIVGAYYLGYPHGGGGRLIGGVPGVCSGRGADHRRGDRGDQRCQDGGGSRGACHHPGHRSPTG